MKKHKRIKVAKTSPNLILELYETEKPPYIII